MPFARISLLKGKAPEYVCALSDALHHALVEAFDVPEDDRFQAIHQHEAEELIFDRHYLGGPRSNNFVLIHITAGKPRDTATKKRFYQRLATRMGEVGLHAEDLMVVITTTTADEWSFGGGRSVFDAVR